MSRLIFIFLLLSALSGFSQINQSVYFESDSYLLTPSEKEKLELFLKKAGDLPNVKIYLTGHTDSDGSVDYNNSLSFNRTRAVYNFFTENGARPANILMKWKGENNPLAQNSDEQGKSMNRRV